MSDLEFRRENLSRIYLFYGEEKHLLVDATRSLVNIVMGKNFSDFNFHELDGEKIDINYLADLIWTLPVMSDKRCVLINDLSIESLSKSDLNKLNELILDVPETTVFIISLKTININLKKSSSWRSFINKVKKVGFVKEFCKLDERDLMKKLILEAKSRNCKLNEENAKYLIRTSGSDLTILLNELEKLSAFKMNREITRSDIDKLAVKSLEASVFVLAKLIINKDIIKAYIQLNNLIENKQEPIAILSVLSLTYIDIFRAKLAVKNLKDTSDLMKAFPLDYKGKEFKIKNAIRDSYKFSYNQLEKSLNIIMETDIKLKSLQVDKKILMQVLITKLFLVMKGEL